MAMNSDKDTRLAGAARRAPYLEREHERELTERWHQHKDEQALHQLISSHMRLVIALASRFRNYGLPMSDLVQEGNVGLLEAATRFEPSREVRFSTYAAWWIRAALQDYVLRNWSIVRGGTSSRQKSLFFKLRRLRSRIQARHHDLDPTLIAQRIALDLGVTAKDVDTMSARLSGGEAKRGALALAFALAPELLLLDEPTNHLDIDGITLLEELLLKGPALIVGKCVPGLGDGLGCRHRLSQLGRCILRAAGRQVHVPEASDGPQPGPFGIQQALVERAHSRQN